MKTKAIILGFIPILTIGLYSCGGSEETEDANNTEVEVNLPYEEGGAKTAEDFYYGALEDVLRVDEKLRYVQDLDLMDSSEDSITEQLDSMILLIREGRDAVDHYMNAEWPKHSEFFALTNDWFDGVEGIVNDYFYKMAEPMSRPDDTWTDGEKALYAEYEEAIYEFYEIDEQWVIFQSEYADANEFELNSDEDGIIP